MRSTEGGSPAREPGLASAARANPRFFGAMLVDALGSGLFLPFSFVYFMAVTDLGVSEVGAAVAVSKLVSVPFGLVAGGAVDRWGAFPVARIGNYRSAHGTMVGELAASSLDDWFALTSVTRNAGLGLGGLLAAGAVGLGGTLGLRVLVLANAVSFVVAALLLVGMRDGRIEARRTRDRADGAWATVLRDRRFLHLVAVKLAFVYCAVVLPVMVPVFLENSLGLPVGLGGVLFAVNCVLVVLGQSRVVTVTRGRRIPAIAVAGVLYAGAAAVASVPKYWKMRLLTSAAMCGVIGPPRAREARASSSATTGRYGCAADPDRMSNRPPARRKAVCSRRIR